MKKKLLFITMLCVSHIMCFAQVKVQSDGKIGIGTMTPKSSIHFKARKTSLYPSIRDSIIFSSGLVNLDNGICLDFGYAGMWDISASLSPLNMYPTTTSLGKSSSGGIGVGRWGSIYSMTNVDVFSDFRAKENIKELPEGILNKVLDIRPVSYNFKDSVTGRTGSQEKRQEIGFIAQELQKIFPDVVSHDEENDSYGIRYESLIPYLVKAMKEQQIQIEGQQEQIKQLVKLVNIQSIHEKAFGENGIESIPLLLQNTPNPFNQEATEIGYYIPENDINKIKK